MDYSSSYYLEEFAPIEGRIFIYLFIYLFIFLIQGGDFHAFDNLRFCDSSK